MKTTQNKKLNNLNNNYITYLKLTLQTYSLYARG